jgi:queuine tRNA-ribosyltransferase
MYKIISEAKKSLARVGKLSGRHSAETPFFMPVATKASVKQLSAEDLTSMNVPALISNSFLLSLKPGTTIIKKMGGIHNFMNYHGMTFTDSGGFQMLNAQFLLKNEEEGVTFKSPYDGRKLFITPEDVMRIEEDIKPDVAMMLDNLPPHGSTREEVLVSVNRTKAWAERCMKSHKDSKQLLFGITQGSVYKDLRTKSTRDIVTLDPDGIALGGLCIGETQQQMFDVISLSKKIIPTEKPVYLMGVGSPHDIIECVHMGVDVFDSRFATRNARHGTLFTRKGNLMIDRKEFVHDEGPIDPTCSCFVCKNYSRAYIQFQLKQKEAVGMRLASYHNVWFITKFMEDIRTSIREGEFLKFRRDFLKKYRVNKVRGPFEYSQNLRKTFK